MHAYLDAPSAACGLLIVSTHAYNSSDPQISNFSIRSHSEQFTSDRVMVTLKWTLSTSQIYYQQLLQNVSISVVPDLEMAILFIGNMSVQLTLQYNSLYNVSVTQPGFCGRFDQTISIDLNYSKML